MRALALILAASVTLSLSACGSDDSSDDTTIATTAETTAETTAGADVPDVVGSSVEDATATLEAAGFTLRVVRRDGEDLPATMDFVENRINVAVETQDGVEVVTEVVSTG